MNSNAGRSMSTAAFMHPNQMLHGLLATPDAHHTSQQTVKRVEKGSSSLKKVESQIEGLHQMLDSMNNEVVEVEGLLAQRDMLYHQLDHLRNEREEIEDEISSQDYTLETTYKTTGGTGLKQMNDRLRRRIRQVRDYIAKMQSENQKLEGVLHSGWTQPQACNYTEYGGPRSPTWLDRINSQAPVSNSRSYKKMNHDYFDGMRKRLQAKQQEAWERVRRQEEEIDSRNARSLMNFGGTGRHRPAYLSPKYRGFY